jgi:hypothetical protein
MSLSKLMLVVIPLAASSPLAFADQAETQDYSCPSTITVAGKSEDSAWKQSVTSHFDGHTDLRPSTTNPNQQELWCSYTYSKTIKQNFWVYRTVSKTATCTKTDKGFKNCL